VLALTLAGVVKLWDWGHQERPKPTADPTPEELPPDFNAPKTATIVISRPVFERELAVQMAAKHVAAMAVLAKLDVAFATEQRVAAFGSAAARLMRAYATQVEVLRR
jgi:hypothetical protein